MLSLRIALRYLIAKKSHTAVNIIAVVAISGVAIATLAMVVVMSIFNGFRDLAESQLSHLDPEISVERTDGRFIADGDSLAREIESLGQVAIAVPTLSERGLLVTPSTQMPVRFKGVGKGYEALTDIDRVIIDGSFETGNTAEIPAIQVAVGVANTLLSAPSPTGLVDLYVPRREGRINPANPSAAFRGSQLVISGVFQVNNSDVDADNVIIPIETARDLLLLDNGATAIEVKGTPGTSTTDLVKAIKAKVGDSFEVKTRIEQRAESFRMIQIEKWVTFMMLTFILVITLFNVISTLSLLVIEKRSNMATLRALGARPSLVAGIFTAEGFLVTAVGGVIGIVLGVGLSLAQQYGRFIGLSADSSALSIDYYPVRVSPADVGLVAALIVLTGLVTGLVTRLFVRGRTFGAR